MYEIDIFLMERNTNLFITNVINNKIQLNIIDTVPIQCTIPLPE